MDEPLLISLTLISMKEESIGSSRALGSVMREEMGGKPSYESNMWHMKGGGEKERETKTCVSSEEYE